MANEDLRDGAPLPPVEEVDQLAGLAVGDLIESLRSRAPVEIAFDVTALSPAQRQALEAELALGIEAARKLKEEGRAAILSADEQRALAGLTHVVTRPSLRIVGSELTEPPRIWEALHADRKSVTDAAAAVGRIDTWSRQATGTGWFVTRDLLLTNAHVVAQLCGIYLDPYGAWQKLLLDRWQPQNAAWVKHPETRPWWDPADAPGGGPAPGRITRIRAVHDRHDMALLEVEGADGEGIALPLSADPPRSSTGRAIYVTGYPSLTHHDLHPLLATLLFGATVTGAVKRVAPGRLGDVDGAVARHDASTLGGSSGSPVVDLQDHHVYVLHASGWYGITNRGVALWTITDDPFFADNGIAFASPGGAS